MLLLAKDRGAFTYSPGARDFPPKIPRTPTIKPLILGNCGANSSSTTRKVPVERTQPTSRPLLRVEALLEGHALAVQSRRAKPPPSCPTTPPLWIFLINIVLSLRCLNASLEGSDRSSTCHSSLLLTDPGRRKIPITIFRRQSPSYTRRRGGVMLKLLVLQHRPFGLACQPTGDGRPPSSFPSSALS